MFNRESKKDFKSIFKLNLRVGQKGVTLMELLVAIVLITLISLFSFSFFAKINKKEALEKDKSSLIALLRNAREFSVSSKNASIFGVHLESNKAVLFRGSTYVAGAEGESILEFNNEVTLSSYNLALSNEDILFQRLLGNVENYGTVTLSLIDNSASSTITILSTGVIQ